jgi:hypothetical protein
MRLEPHHKKIWYDYTRLKFEENEAVSDVKIIKSLINNADEEIEWVQSILARKT